MRHAGNQNRKLRITVKNGKLYGKQRHTTRAKARTTYWWRSCVPRMCCMTSRQR